MQFLQDVIIGSFVVAFGIDGSLGGAAFPFLGLAGHHVVFPDGGGLGFIGVLFLCDLVL